MPNVLMSCSERFRQENQSLQIPPSSGSKDKLLAGGLLLWLLAFPLLSSRELLLSAPVVGIFTFLVLWRQHRAASHLGIFASHCLVASLLGAPSSQVFLGLGVVGCLMIVWATPWLHGSIDWLSPGRLDRSVAALSISFVGLSAAALVLWHQLVHPDLRDIFQTFVPDLPLSLLLLGGLLFSMVNAAVEEAAYRGLVFSALRSTYGSGGIAHLGQAVAFGALHFHVGFPRGVIGVALAVVYGVMMSVLRVRSGGMLAPWAVHVLIDIAIVLILLFLVR